MVIYFVLKRKSKQNEHRFCCVHVKNRAETVDFAGMLPFIPAAPENLKTVPARIF